jgi:large subunit ribosomal protein L42
MFSLQRLVPVTRFSYRSLCTSLPVTARKVTKPYREERVVVTSDGAVICCWHPEPKFPYELSKPIPRSEMPGTNSPLKVQMTEDMKELYHHKPERFHRRDLMKLTWTTKHKWFPNRKQQEKAMDERKNPREKPFL